MKKASLVVHKVYQRNEIFKSDSPLNRDNCLEFFHQLKKQLSKKGFDLNTQDITPAADADIVIYNEIPKNQKSEIDFNKSAALIFESELVRPANWKIKNHRLFSKLFTWNDALVDGRKYIKFNFTHSGRSQFKNFTNKRKLCTLISGNKFIRHPLELYSKRVEAIKWFEKNHPDDFEFYGTEWNLHTFRLPIVYRLLNKLTFLRKFLAQPSMLYRGQVTDKLITMQDFKFSICYENARDITGYITEKIFDSMAAGCVPVYWGAPNVSDYIPSQCYINKADFSSYEELYSYLSQMSEGEYNSRQQAIAKFLDSKEHQQFEAFYNARIVCEALTRD